MDGKIGDRRAEIYTYESENIVYGLSWSVSHSSLHTTKRGLSHFICSPWFTEAGFASPAMLLSDPMAINWLLICPTLLEGFLPQCIMPRDGRDGLC